MLVYVRPLSEHLPFSTTLSKGVAKVALYCAHRATTFLNHSLRQARLFLFYRVAWSILECARRTSTFLCARSASRRTTRLPAPLYFTRNGLEFSPEAVVTVRRTRPFFPPLGTVVVMLSLFC